MWFSCSLYNNTGASVTPTLMIDTPGAGDLTPARTWTNRASVALQACPAGAVTPLSALVNASGLSGIANGMKVYVRLPSGSMTGGKSVTFSQFSLVPDQSYRTTYSPPDPDLELLRAYLYYQKTFPYAVAPAQAAGPNGMLNGYAATLGNFVMNWEFFVPMWASPTVMGAVTTYNPAAAAASAHNYTDNTETAVSFNLISEKVVSYIPTAAAANDANDRIGLHFVANAELS